MEALLDAADSPGYPAQIALVLSNQPDATGLQTARSRGIPAICVDHKDYENRASHEAVLTETLQENGIEFVCLAGYMRILEPEFVTRWLGKLVNIHPSILPAFKGVDTHRRALNAGIQIHGCTVHYVNADLDDGPIIAQSALRVAIHETPESLAARVLQLEHHLYPYALKLIAERKVHWSGSGPVARTTNEPLGFLH